MVWQYNDIKTRINNTYLPVCKLLNKEHTLESFLCAAVRKCFKKQKMHKLSNYHFGKANNCNIGRIFRDTPALAAYDLSGKWNSSNLPSLCVPLFSYLWSSESLSCI